jgi:hypothetical protein
LGNINYMRYTHAARSIPRGPWEVRCAYFIFYLSLITQLTLLLIVFQDFGRLLMDSLAANGVSSNYLVSWKGALGVFVNGIAPQELSALSGIFISNHAEMRLFFCPLTRWSSFLLANWLIFFLKYNFDILKKARLKIYLYFSMSHIEIYNKIQIINNLSCTISIVELE